MYLNKTFYIVIFITIYKYNNITIYRKQAALEYLPFFERSNFVHALCKNVNHKILIIDIIAFFKHYFHCFNKK